LETLTLARRKDIPEPAAPDSLWVLMVTSMTSTAHQGWPGDVTISDLETAALPAPSLARNAKIVTIVAGVARHTGRLSAAAQARVKESLGLYLPNIPGD